MNILLEPRSAFSLASVIRSHGWVRLSPFVELENEIGFETAVQLDAGPACILLVSEASDGIHVGVNNDLDNADLSTIEEMAAWMLGLEQDLSDFYAACKHEQKLASVEAEAKGRLLRSPSLFEDVVKTILTTNTSWSGTVRMVDALVSGYGEPVHGVRSRCAFPDPAALARVDETDLRVTGKLGYRAPYVLELAQRVESGALDLEEFKDVSIPTPELRNRLLKIKGVGGYAAAALLMLLGRYDYVPVDSWARKMVSQEWYDGQPVGEKEIEAAFSEWGKWKGLAYWFWDWSDPT